MRSPWLPPRGEDRYEKPEQEATGFERGPRGPIEDAMIGLKLWGIREPHDTQNRGDGSVARGEDGAGEEDFGMWPNGS